MGGNGHAEEARRLNDEIEQYAHNVDISLRKHPSETFTTETPLSKVFAGENRTVLCCAAPSCPHCDGPLDWPEGIDEWMVRNETIKTFSEFLSQDGLEPWKVMRNLYSAFAYMGLPPWVELTVREKGLMLGDSHGSQHFRMEKMVQRRSPAKVVQSARSEGN